MHRKTAEMGLFRRLAGSSPVTHGYAGSPSPAPFRVIIVITTFNRHALLEGLIDSIRADSEPVAGVVVVDNASTDSTQAYLEALGSSLTGSRGEIPLVVERMTQNSGGAGGFRRGMELALGSAFDEIVPRAERWVWLMDDDVDVISGGLGRLCRRPLKADLIHGQRISPDGTPFFWRHVLDPSTGVHWPMREPQRSAPVAETNVACFEGALISSLTVDRVGLPDPSFFIASDDTTYGFLASRRVRVVVTDEPLLRKTRQQASLDLGVRHLNDSSDLSRYYMMRNRGLMAAYLKETGDYRPAGFALGTVLTGAKELVRLGAVELPRSVRAKGAASALRAAAPALSAVGRGFAASVGLLRRPLPRETRPIEGSGLLRESGLFEETGLLDETGQRAAINPADGPMPLPDTPPLPRSEPPEDSR